MRHKGSIIGEGWRYLQVWLDFPVRDTLSMHCLLDTSNWNVSPVSLSLS